MKTIILIQGQISGNHTLHNAIAGYSEAKKGMFNSWELTFETKKEAKKSLWQAFKYLRSDKDDTARLSYSKEGALYYDASNAKILQ